MGNALGNGRRALAEEVPVGYKRTEVGVIPEDWDVIRLGDCGEIIMGQSPSGMSYNQSGIGSPLINGPTEFTELHPVKVQWTTQPARFCKPGDLLICVRGSSTGRTNYADEIYAIGRGVAAIRAKADNDTQYLSYQVISGVSDLLAAATGSTFPSVDGASFRKILVLLPSPAEQRAIAEALSDVDRLLVALEALIAKKRAIKQAAMQQLLTSKSRLPGFNRTWETKRIGVLFEAKAGGDVDPTRSSDVQSDSHPYPIYANSLLQEGLYGFCNYAENRPGSITVTARGTLGKAFYRDTPFVAIGRLLVLEPKVRMDARFFSSYINHSIHFAVESTGVPQLTAPQVARYSLPVPPEPEQRTISETLSDMDAEITALQRRRDKTRVVKQGMMQQLLTGRVRLISDLRNE